MDVYLREQDDGWVVESAALSHMSLTAAAEIADLLFQRSGGPGRLVLLKADGKELVLDDHDEDLEVPNGDGRRNGLPLH